MEDFSTYAADGHRQVVVNTEVMKHMMVVNKASVREIMLQHERTFKEQVQDLHKLYEVQRTLMHKAKTAGHSTFLHGASNSSADNAQNLAQGHRSSKRTEMSVESTSSPISSTGFLRVPSDSGNLFDQQGAGVSAQRDSKNIANSSRRKVIDLEQLPEDDTDDEMEKPEDVNLPSTRGSSSPVPGHKNANFCMKDDAFSRYPAPYSKLVPEPNVLTNSGNLEALNEKSISHGGVKDQNVSGVSKADQEIVKFPAIKKEPDWMSQGSNMKLLGSDLIQLQEKPSAPVLMEPDYRQHWESHQDFQSPTLGQHRIRMLPAEDRSHSVANWSHTIGVFPNSLEMPEEPSKSLTSSAYSYGCTYAAVSAVRTVNIKPSGEHGRTTSGFVPASADIPNAAKVQPEKNVWYPQNTTAQFPQFQQQTINRTGWLQSSQNVHQNFYPQQANYSTINGNDGSHIGFRIEELQRGQAGGISSNNMSGIGNYFCSSQNFQTPDFMKPPDMVLKNHGSGMELNIPAPEVEPKACQKMLSNSSRQDSSQDNLRCQEKRGSIQRDANSEEIRRGRNSLTNADSQAHVELGVFPMPVPPGSKVVAATPSTCDHSESGYNMPSRAPGAAESLSTKEHTGSYDSGLHNVKQLNQGLVQKDEIKMIEASISSGKENGCCSMDAISHQLKGENHDLGLAEQGSHVMPPTEDGTGGAATANEPPHSFREHASGARLEETNGLSSATPMAVDGNLNFPCNVADTIVVKPHVGNCVGDNYVGNALETGDEAAVNPSAESFPPTEDDSRMAAVAHGGGARKHDRHAVSGTTPGQGSDLSTSSQLTMQAVSVQSSSTDLMPGNVKQERECSSKETESSTFRGVPGKGSTSSTTRKRKSVASGSEHPSLPLEKLAFDNKPEIDVDESSDNLQHISDSETLAAAAILLSFAAKKTAESSCKYWKDDVGRAMNKGQKHGSAAEHTPSCSRQAMVGRNNKVSPKKDQYEDVESSDCQAYAKSKVQCSVKRVDNLGAVRFKLKDRTREEPMQLLQQHEHGKKESNNSTRTKIPKVVSIGNSVDESVAFPRSKQLNKLNAAATVTVVSKAMDVYGHSAGHKGKDGHTLTGRRSSRGPPMAGRMHQESRGRPTPAPLYSEHYSDGDGEAGLETTQSRRRERNAQSPCKFEAGMKSSSSSKVWSDMNRRRSRSNRTQAAQGTATFKKYQR